VRERATGNVFAMKKLKKSEMVRRGQARALPGCSNGAPLASLRGVHPHLARRASAWVLTATVGSHAAALPLPPAGSLLTRSVPQVDHVKAERNLLAEVNNPSIVKLFYSFQVHACAR